MGVFDDIKLSWKGEEFTIPAKRVMGAIARIEDVITLVELQRFHASGAPPLSKLCMAYGAVLRYAGVRVDDDEVYAGLFGSAGHQSAIMEALTVILAMMIPPDAMRAVDEAPASGNSRAAAAPTSKKRSKRRSVRASG